MAYIVMAYIVMAYIDKGLLMDVLTNLLLAAESDCLYTMIGHRT